MLKLKVFLIVARSRWMLTLSLEKCRSIMREGSEELFDLVLQIASLNAILSLYVEEVRSVRLSRCGC
jgi:hypothetical protein